MNFSAFARKSLLIFILLGVALSSACTSGAGTTVSPTSTQASLPTQAPATAQATEPTSGELVACRPYQCSIPAFWKIGPNGTEPLPLSITPGQPYDATAATGRLLYASKFPSHGAGPGNVSVGDLWWLDVRSGETHPIIQDEVVVEAVWAPNGQNFAYVRATPETYELHWYTASGEDKLLAKDVAFTFSVSPAGDQVAFSRESKYNVGGTPGFYVVDVASGQERQISNLDRAGVGSMVDLPVWSPDARHILLPVSSSQANDWFMIATDGSGAAQLKSSVEASSVIANNTISFVLWHPDGLHLVGSTVPGMAGGPMKTVLFGLNPGLDTLVSATLIAENDATIVSWDKPGVSLWVSVPDRILQNVKLP